MSTPAGWYQDPSGDVTLHRYWDGTQWTEHTQRSEPVPPAPVPPAPVAAEPAMPPAPLAPQQDVPGVSGMPDVQAVHAVQEQPVPPAPGYDTTQAHVAQQTAGSSGGIRTELLSDDQYAEVGSGERVVLQNNRMLKVMLGQDVLARQGSMVAFQGQMDFDHEGSGAAKFMKKALTGEGLALMRCTGQGELFLANRGHQVHIIHLDGSGLTVNGANILAFEPSLTWDIERIKGAGMTTGGLFNTRLEGHGWVAITTDGPPVVLRTDQPTFVDTDAAVAWSANLETSLNRTVKAKALIGRGSGEAVQLTFRGSGIVIVQPSENQIIPAAP